MPQRKHSYPVPYLFTSEQHDTTHLWRVVVRRSRGGRVVYITAETFTSSPAAFRAAFDWAEAQGFDVSSLRNDAKAVA